MCIFPRATTKVISEKVFSKWDLKEEFNGFEMHINYLGNKNNYVNVFNYYKDGKELSYTQLWRLKSYFSMRNYDKFKLSRAVRMIVEFIIEKGEDSSKLDEYFDECEKRGKMKKYCEKVAIYYWSIF